MFDSGYTNPQEDLLKQTNPANNRLTMIGERHTLEEILDAVSQATLAIAEAEDLKEILQQITDAVSMLTGAEFVAMGILDEDTVEELVVSNGRLSDTSPHDDTSTDLIRTITKQKSTVRYSSDTNHTAEWPISPDKTSELLGVPIICDGDTKGAIVLTNEAAEKTFSRFDQKIVETLAGHAAIAIRKSNLLKERKLYTDELKQRTSQLRALNRATMAIAGELALDSVLQQIVDSVRELVNASYAALGVPNAEGFLDSFIHSGMPPEDVEQMPHYPKGLGLLGAIIHEKVAIRIPHISQDPRSVGFPEEHPAMDRFLGVPVIANGEMLGNLYLTDKIDGSEFTQEDQTIVEMLAAHAAIAIQNARLYEQVGRLAIVEERTRIGMDLHDGVIQSIYAVGLTLESTRLAIGENPDEADELIGNAINALNDTIRDIRNFILDLRPHRFRGDLREGLARLIREFQANTMVMVTLSAPEGVFKNLPTSIARAIFLTTQEALANIARHAKATEATIEIQRTTSAFSIRISDNGQGFDTKANKERVGHGLSNMEARIEELNGQLYIESKPGEGTTILMKLPIRKTNNR